MEKYDFIVLGAGLAGLSFAKRMTENGYSVLLLEKEGQVGGISRTIRKNGFYLDFCAHRFHSNNKDLLNEVLSLPGLKMYKHIKKSRIYMFNKYLKYPFEIQNLLRAMPVTKSFLSGISFGLNLVTKVFRKKRIRSYKDWFIHFYGKRLYDVMCYPYTSKIWRTDPADIAADWADQRFQGENMAKLLKRIIKKIVTLDFSKYSIEDDSLAPDGGIFYYPLKGIQELPDALNSFSIKNGAKTICSAVVKKISRKSRTVSYSHNGRTFTKKYGTLISTIPLHAYYSLQDRKDRKFEETLSSLKYMDIIFVYAFLNRKNISNDHWLYFPDKEIIFNRAVEFRNWSPKMCPEGKTSVCFDVTAYEDDEIWSMSDKEISDRVLEDAYGVDYLKRGEVYSTLVYRLKYAYPFYDLDYQENLDKVVHFLEDEHSYLLGRTGIFRYNNADNSIEMAFELADNFLKKKDKKSIYKYEIRNFSY
ncbi:MAG: FAD-dependent oxidoreductase [Spirochaetes bacterium]|jgi:protoporphyrinogen oxidase|nr:FAD-dependent oxidoreductase [Spirochaetota bacterium]